MSIDKSTINKFTIRHSSETVGSTHDFPCLPSLPLKGTRNLVSIYAYRDYKGTLHQRLVASLPKIMMKFENVEYSKAKILLVDYMDDKINSSGNKNFYLNIKHPIHGWIKGLFTLGTPDTAEIIGNFSGSGDIDLVNFELHFEAVEGIKLNQGQGV